MGHRMAICNQSYFVREIELDVKEELSQDLKVSHGDVLIIVQHTKHNTGIFHLLFDRSLPVLVPIFLVKLSCFCGGIWDFDSKLEVFSNEPSSYCQDYLVSLLEPVAHPP
jgi:hypothetical protein